jgi:hypothetical protein
MGSVLFDMQAQRGKVEHLAPLCRVRGDALEVIPAVRAAVGHMDVHLVRRLHLHARTAGVAGLATRLLPAALAQALARRPPEGGLIAGGRLVAVVAVLRQPDLQFPHALVQRLDLGLEVLEKRLHQRDDRVGTCFVNRKDLLACHHRLGSFEARVIPLFTFDACSVRRPE